MKKYSSIKESYGGAPGNTIPMVLNYDGCANPKGVPYGKANNTNYTYGNSLCGTVTNHWTPIENIATNVRNIFGTRGGLVVSVAEDGKCLKIESSRFCCKEEVERILTEPWFRDNISIVNYVNQQGLDVIKVMKCGRDYCVYCCPSDVCGCCCGGDKECDGTCKCGTCVPDPCDGECPCESLLGENEIFHLFEDGDDDAELEVEAKKKIKDIISGKDKIKGAKELSEIVKKSMSLPDNIYLCGVRDKDGKESIALRWKYEKKRPYDKKTDIIRSIMNIFDDGNVWISDFDKDSIIKLPKEIDTLLHNMIEILGAEESDDECLYTISKEEKDKGDDTSKDASKEKDQDTKKEDEPEDVEDDPSRE